MAVGRVSERGELRVRHPGWMRGPEGGLRSCFLDGPSFGALEGALLLADEGARVEICMRGDSFRARRQFVDRVHQHPSITIAKQNVVALESCADKLCVTSVDVAGNHHRSDIDYLLVKIGFTPNLPILNHELELSHPDGYVQVNRWRQTSHSWIYAIGDVASPYAQTLVTAAGDGAAAAFDIASKIGVYSCRTS